MKENIDPKKIYKFNMSFYYQSTIIYIIVLFLYAMVKGEFLEDRFELITRDPVIYFFLLIVFISLVALVYNLLLKRQIELTDNGIVIKKGKRQRVIRYQDIEDIKVFKEKGRFKTVAFRRIRLRIKGRKLPLTIRPYDYYDNRDLMDEIRKLKSRLPGLK